MLAWPSDRAGLLAAGLEVRVLCEKTNHHRISNADGLSIDYWPSTQTWAGAHGGKRGKGLDIAVANMISAPAPKKAKAFPVTPSAPKPDVTIFSDASVCVKTRAGGWGAWMIRTGHKPVEAGGQFRDLPIGSADAEAMALCNALHHGLVVEMVRPGEVAMLQSDNLACLATLARIVPGCFISHGGGATFVPARQGRLMKNPALLMIRDLVSRHDLKVVVRHVRGHQDGDGRQWVNRRCDEIAKAHMRARRRAIQSQQETAA